MITQTTKQHPKASNRGGGWKMARLLTAFAMLLTAFTAVSVVGDVGEADARCKGKGVMGPTIGSAYAWEAARVSSTCDGLGDYYGKTMDIKIDGHCIVAVYEGVSNFRNPTNCKNSTWLKYGFSGDNNKESAFKLCRYDPGWSKKTSRCTAPIKNWGY